MNEKGRDEIVNAATTEDGRYLLIETRIGDKNNLFYADISTKNITGRIHPKTVLDNFIGTTECFHNQGSNFYCNTDIGAKEGRIVLIDIEKPQLSNWIELLSENKNQVQEDFILVDDKIFIKYNKDGMHTLKVFKLGNPIKYIAEIRMPGIGVINSLKGDK